MEQRRLPGEDNQTSQGNQDVIALVPPTISMPRVVDEQGNDLGPMNPSALQEIMQLAQYGQVVRLRKALERRQTKGLTESHVLSANDQQQVLQIGLPFQREKRYSEPWARVFLENKGPSTVHVALHTPDDWFDLDPTDKEQIDLLESDNRLRNLYYYCDDGQTATLIARGKF